jgi:predicted regulator of Ras-like GTPase activity (Roadblock/LC7/MglB family)
VSILTTMADTLTPEHAAERLCELSADVRAAVLLDAAGSPAGAGGDGREDAGALGELARQLFEEVDRATRDWDTEPPEQVEVQVPGGAVFASRTPRWTLAAVAKRGALSSLMLYDLRALLRELEGGPPIRRSRPAGEGAAAEEGAAGAGAQEAAPEEVVAEELPMPELGGGDASDDGARE